MANRGVKIIGMGAVSSIGVGIDATLESLRSGRSGIGPIKNCATTIDVPAGEVDTTEAT